MFLLLPQISTFMVQFLLMHFVCVWLLFDNTSCEKECQHPTLFSFSLFCLHQSVFDFMREVFFTNFLPHLLRRKSLQIVKDL